MSNYVFIESRDPWDSADSEGFRELVQGVSRRGHKTTLFLMQNGVFPARKGAHRNRQIADLIKNHKVRVLADDFSLKERAIRSLIPGVETASMGQIVDLLIEPDTQVIWH